MLMFLVVVAIFVLSVAIGSLVGSALASVVINGMQRRLVASRETAPALRRVEPDSGHALIESA